MQFGASLQEVLRIKKIRLMIKNAKIFVNASHPSYYLVLQKFFHTKQTMKPKKVLRKYFNSNVLQIRHLFGIVNIRKNGNGTQAILRIRILILLRVIGRHVEAMTLQVVPGALHFFFSLSPLAFSLLCSFSCFSSSSRVLLLLLFVSCACSSALLLFCSSALLLFCSFAFCSSFMRRGAIQSIGLTDVAVENKFLFQLLHDFNPDDNGGNGAPEGSNADRYDAKEDLRICSARLKQSPSRQCRCKKSVCVKNMVARYFQFIQLSENAVSDRKGKNKEWLLDAVSIGLDVLGMIDPFGIVADLLNAGLAAAREQWSDAIIGVVASLPALGSMFAPMKWIEKGVIKVSGKFQKWSKAVSEGLQHPKLLEFVKDLGAKAVGHSDGAVTTVLKGFANVIEKVASALMFVLRKGNEAMAKVTKIVAGAVSADLESFRKVQQKMGGFLTDILTRVGCFSKGGQKMAAWGVILFEKVGYALEFFDTFKIVGEWTQAVSPW